MYVQFSFFHLGFRTTTDSYVAADVSAFTTFKSVLRGVSPPIECSPPSQLQFRFRGLQVLAIEGRLAFLMDSTISPYARLSALVRSLGECF